MPVTKTATRALRSSDRKRLVNRKITTGYEIAMRAAKKSQKIEDIKKAISLVDRAAKKSTIHKNKASRIKAQLSRLGATVKSATAKAVKAKTTSKTAGKK